MRQGFFGDRPRHLELAQDAIKSDRVVGSISRKSDLYCGLFGIGICYAALWIAGIAHL
jgi:hypothetical protein